LYWGAVWCPPCHNLKKNFFTKAEFIKATKDFVPVYLDGDTERAQIWGEKFAIAGYPTVIIFSPTGVELFRMPTDVTAEQYGKLLLASVQNFRPVEEILADVSSNGASSVDQLELELIAYHPWMGDRDAELTDQGAFDLFWKIHNELGEDQARLRTRFMILSLERAVARIGVVKDIFGDAGLVELDEVKRSEFRTEIISLLESPELWVDNKVFLTLQSAATVATLAPEANAGRDELVALWLASARSMQDHPEFSDTERLMAFVPEFELVSPTGGSGEDEVPTELQERIQQRVQELTVEPHDPGEFQSTLNMMAHLMVSAGLEEEAVALLDEHMDETIAPHYFLSLRGDLSADDPEEALEWHRKAFDSSGSGSSRIRWGSEYVAKRIELAPEDAAGIERAMQELLGAVDDVFAGRNYGYVRGLDPALTAWAVETGNEAVAKRLREGVVQQCARFKESMDETQYERCMAFLGSGDSEIE
ncbi:MAG: thioredoxin family protein, partial [Acidobacteriota bacterium]